MLLTLKRWFNIPVKGEVRWFNSQRGYGFIELTSGEDVFVHYSKIKSKGFRSLHPSQPVELTVEKNQQGWQAKEVNVL